MPNLETATLGGGCFWCLEAVYERMEGVRSVTSGYMGGDVENPTYKEVCTGTTGHVEVVQVVFDPEVTSYGQILDVFFSIHDPTTRDRQGNDTGPQYRSVIFTHSDQQQATAAALIRELEASGAWPAPIVTEVRPAASFYRAEDYHQGYFQANSQQPYCAYVVAPKVRKFLEKFGPKAKASGT
ncbi:MAG TPA: peptide-methionine (S)-S-oxide reductase MsrA [Bryobacteraceae bacterium]|nr:peptide-methionine (S)-S-oxide reductase MsrA [Bryobacteraceae bacterium]